MLCVISAGVITFIIRYKVLNLEKPIELSPNLLSVADWSTISHAFFLFVFCLIPLVSSPISTNILQYLSLACLTSVVSLNTYFSNFWMDKSKKNSNSTNLEALKLEHNNWDNLFKGVSLIFLIPIGGVAYKYLIDTSFSNISFQIQIDAISVIYNILGAPIFWLLRPIYIHGASIRTKIAGLENMNDVYQFSRRI